ncbi:MAG TPA: NAD(P)/FAD-dependent oxidoreductase [Acidimicrobiales bacterium]|nr:NAD(P)/FAD-dependent oxidoreductase [Acidimicrobiales bacterium]
MAADTWDVIVIGGGPAGENAAQYAVAGSDRTAVLVEAELLGGECSYWACIPSKALLRPVEILDAARNVAGAAAAVTGQVDVAAALARRDYFNSHRNDKGQVDWAHGVGLDVVRGRGRLTGPKTVTVTTAEGATRTLHATAAVVLATGTTAAIPPTPGLREALPWTSRDVTNLVEVPQRVAVIGGGVVACEATTWLRGLGAEVTVLVRGRGLLSGNEPFAGELVAQRLAETGVTVTTGATVDRVSRPEVAAQGIGRIHGGPAVLSTNHGELEVDEIVVATGRVPASSDLGLDTVGVDTSDSHGFVTVDEHCNVVGAAGDWLYAVGDLNGKALLTHMGKYQGRIAGAVIGARAEGRPLEGSRYCDQADNDRVPAVVFTDPQVAAVGLDEAGARAKGIDVETVEYDLGEVHGAPLLRDDYRGRAKLVIDRATDTLVGATFVGSDVAELLHSATTAIVGRVTLETMWHAVPSFPSVSEVWLRLLESR